MADSALYTTGAIARLAEVSQQTVQLYIKLGLIDCAKSTDGRWLLCASAVARVREIYAQRTKTRARLG